ncbi:carbohydrate kinase family protein [uncultured Tateyamaria sp.]|uniref:carbohydrate kinase family protein n=1 Tax=uncultured Tateyamaria sp. TaxID=455651 RepID=UPI002623C8D0|nr:carbohydrate kinase family protein [uncultured Tateyamaria sp.]
MDIVEGESETFAAAGGSCGNVMALLSFMGWHTQPVARLGTDNAGSFITEEFERLGVDTSHITCTSGVRTPIVIQRFVESSNGERTHRFSLTCPDCGAWLPRYRPTTIKHASEVIEKDRIPDAFFFDRVSPCALKLSEWAREKGALVVFEPSSIGDERQFQKAVDTAHILKYSHDRLGHLPDLAKVSGPKIVIETHGAEGLRVRWRSRWSTLPAIRAIHLVDAAGSGDWCTAGIIHAIGEGGSKALESLDKGRLDYGLRLGQALAAINCGFEGARGAMDALDIKRLNTMLSDSTEDVPTLDRPAAVPSAPPPASLCHSCADALPSGKTGLSENSKKRAGRV